MSQTLLSTDVHVALQITGPEHGVFFSGFGLSPNNTMVRAERKDGKAWQGGCVSEKLCGRRWVEEENMEGT